MQGQAEVIKALAPLFAAGLAIQQLIEFVDSLLAAYDPTKTLGDRKKPILKMVAILLGVVVASRGGLTVLSPLGYTTHPQMDIVLSALIIAGGTESLNSIVKFLGYAKEDKKTTAAIKEANATDAEKVSIAKMSHK